MTQTVPCAAPPAVTAALPAAHHVAFHAAGDTDVEEARRYLLAELARAGCTGTREAAQPAGAATVGLPGGGSAVLAVGKAAGSLAGPGYWTAGITITAPGRNTSAGLFAILAVLDSLPFTGWELDRVREQMPVTAGIARHLGTGTFADVAVLCAIHHMRDFTAMAGALTACGARPGLITIIDKGYPYHLRGRVDGWLRHRLGAVVVPYPGRSDGIRAHLDRAAAAGTRTLVFDDGGYVLPAVLDHMPERVTEIAGVVEQTMSGIWKIEPYAPIPVPVFSVAESDLKAAVEAPYVAAAAVSAVTAMLPDEMWAGRPALVLGYGRLGRQAARLLRDVHRMRVAVYDPQPGALVTAQVDGFAVSVSLAGLIESHRPLLVLGSAGRGSLTGEHARAFASSAYLASMTSRDYEFSLPEWAQQAERVIDYGPLGHGYLMPGGIELCVLGDGLPVNFHHRESVPGRVIDLVFAALLTGGALLAQPGHGGHRPGRDLACANQALAASPALTAFLARHSDDGAGRRLLTPPAASSPDHARTPWVYGPP
jgi:adenosylhomocysteinase